MHSPVEMKKEFQSFVTRLKEQTAASFGSILSDQESGLATCFLTEDVLKKIKGCKPKSRDNDNENDDEYNG